MGSSGRLVPDVPTHPAHLTISRLDPVTGTWRTLQDVNLPANAVIGG